jgi:apolipoprotein N-acyltransferase
MAVLAVFSGLLGAAAFAPLSLWPCGLVSLALLLVLLKEQPARSAWQIGLLHGLAYGAGTVHWFFSLFGILAVGLIALLAASFAVLALLVAATRSYSPLVRAVLTAVIAVGLEWIRSDGLYLRFPWYTAVHALAASPLWVGGARWVGAYGVSLAVWGIAAAGAFGSRRLWLAYLLLPLAGLLLPDFAAPDRRALLVQTEERTGIDSFFTDLPREKIDLAVLPELAYAEPAEQVLRLRRGPAHLARSLSCPVVFGAPSHELLDVQMENLAVVLNAGGRLMGTFTKQHPVPLVNDGLPGTERPVFPLEGANTLGVAVCYDFDEPEVAASLVRQGATVLAAPTADIQPWGWVEHEHHELLLRLRAIENDRWILRAASSGRSEAIDPHGNPSEECVDIGGPGSAVVAFGHRDTQPLGSRMWLVGPAAAGALVLFVLAHLLRRWRKSVRLAEELSIVQGKAPVWNGAALRPGKGAPQESGDQELVAPVGG